jgi:hypothetical protein
MTIKATSILRAGALLAVAVAALAMAPVAMAVDQGFAPRPDFPGAKQQDLGAAPRADFPGAKQAKQPGKNTGTAKMQRSGQDASQK